MIGGISLRFSEVFNIFLEYSVLKNKFELLNSLLGWTDLLHGYEHANVSPWITGKRPLPDAFISSYLDDNAFDKSVYSLKKYVERGITDKEQIKAEITELFNKEDYPKLIKKFLTEFTTDNLATFLTCILYLSITQSKHLPVDIIEKYGSAELLTDEERELVRYRIWLGSQQSFFTSHRAGHRFATLNIIERLLPKGYIEPKVLNFHFDSNRTDLKTIDDICDMCQDNIAITGEGGIGKTTFLQKVLERTFGTESMPEQYDSNTVIPIFIELSRCPRNIGNWYEDKYQKTNYITRSIADNIQVSKYKYRNYPQLLSSIEEEFRRTLSDRTRSYLLLLDGFNEISTGMSTNEESVRANLSHEIDELRKLPNVRIITTSRVTQSAYYAQNFTRVHLNGLERNEITTHLKVCKYTHTEIEQIAANKNLMACLSIPLFLCIFSSNKETLDIVPETYGEILYNFFHKNSKFYNIRKRLDETNNNPYQHCPYTTEIILDYIVPFLGWYFVQSDTFSLTRMEFRNCIKRAVKDLNEIFSRISSMPLDDFDNDLTNAKKGLRILTSHTNNYELDMIISCIHDYLSIVYEYETSDASDSDNHRYGFIHHHFRDYFSAMWNINMLKLLPYFPNDCSVQEVHKSICNVYWNENEATTIGQILNEHKNKPYLDNRTLNWRIPESRTNEQQLLTTVLDFCKSHGNANGKQWKIMLQNLINTFNICRGELSGINFDKLDLTECNFHNMTCSRKGKTDTLAASFRMCKLSNYTFEPSEHLSGIEECIYSNGKCFTIDEEKQINVWDIISGNQIAQFVVSEDNGYPDANSIGFMKVSPNGKFLAIKVQPVNPDKGASINVYNVETPSLPACKLVLTNTHTQITDFAFTSDSNTIVVIADSKNIYSFDYNPREKGNAKSFKLSKCKRIDCLHSNTRICPGNGDSLYLFTYELDLLDRYDEDEWDNEYDEDDTEEYDDYSDELTPCTILEGDIHELSFTQIYSYLSAANTSPAYCYVPSCDGFIIYDAKEYKLKLFNCKFEDANEIFSSIMEDNNDEMPEKIHNLLYSESTCYVMYSYTCYQVEINAHGTASIMNKYYVPDLGSINNDSQSSELTFSVNTAPSNSRFLLWNDNHETYEWHIESGDPTYKYNTRLYDTKALFTDKERKVSILVHTQNGISIISQETNTLLNAFCFSEQDYKIEQAVYSSASGNLYLLFERSQHNYIKVLNIDLSTTNIIYSALRPSDGNTKMSISDDGNNILITTVQTCDEYDSTTDSLSRIYSAKPNEWFTTAYYVNNEIHLGIAMARTYLKPEFKPRCEVYHKEGNNYVFQYAYVIPELTVELGKYFVHENMDLGIPCCYKQNALQSYWITKGFFISPSEEIKSFLQLTKLVSEENELVECGTINLNCFNMMMVFHSKPIDNRSTVNGTHNTYSYLSNDFSEAMFIHDYELISYWKNLKDKPSDFISFDYKQTPELANGGSTTWDFAIPISDNRFLCCADCYHLYPVNSESGTFDDEIFYSPGLSIANCKFIKSECSDETKEIIRNNAGIL